MNPDRSPNFYFSMTVLQKINLNKLAVKQTLNSINKLSYKWNRITIPNIKGGGCEI